MDETIAPTGEAERSERSDASETPRIPGPVARALTSRGEATGRSIGPAPVLHDICNVASDDPWVVAEELCHRLRNTLTIVGALIQRTLATSSSLGDARSAVADRLASLAQVHGLLATGGDGPQDLASLVSCALAPFNPEGRMVTSSGEPITVDANVSLALSMTFHELATNAVKHGALSELDGRVAIDWSRDADSGALRIDWRERGGPQPVPTEGGGFGSRLIRRVLAPLMIEPLRIDLDSAGLTASMVLAPSCIVAADTASERPKKEAPMHRTEHQERTTSVHLAPLPPATHDQPVGRTYQPEAAS